MGSGSAKGFFEKFPFPIPWIVSAGLALGAGALTLLPSIVEIPGYVATGTRPPPIHFDAVWEAIWLVALILVVGYVLEALSTPMYQVLEGYRLWPKWFREPWRYHHLARRNRLQQQYEISESSQASASSQAFDSVFVWERLAEYPVEDSTVAPTRLGNIMRTMESYGKTHYQLDSQLLWYELTTVAPESLRMELIRSRQSADFLVGTIFTSILFAAAALVTGTLENISGFSDQQGTVRLVLGPVGPASIGPLYVGLTRILIPLGTAHILFGFIVLALIPRFCYKMATEMIKMWAGAVRALVNLGRVQLADQLHLALPVTHKSERKLWKALGGFVQRRDPEHVDRWAEYLDEYKVKTRE